MSFEGELLSRWRTFSGEITKIKTITQEDNCAVCLETLKPSKKFAFFIALTKCKHTFHINCLNDCFNSGLNKCGLCRRHIDAAECEFIKTEINPTRRGKQSRLARREKQRSLRKGVSVERILESDSGENDLLNIFDVD